MDRWILGLLVEAVGEQLGRAGDVQEVNCVEREQAIFPARGRTRIPMRRHRVSIMKPPRSRPVLTASIRPRTRPRAGRS